MLVSVFTEFQPGLLPGVGRDKERSTVYNVHGNKQTSVVLYLLYLLPVSCGRKVRATLAGHRYLDTKTILGYQCGKRGKKVATGILSIWVS